MPSLPQQISDHTDKSFSRVNWRAGAVERHTTVGPQPVVGDRLDVVGLREELAHLGTKLPLVSGQPSELCMYTR
jgi:hypothetical protein